MCFIWNIISGFFRLFLAIFSKSSITQIDEFDISTNKIAVERNDAIEQKVRDLRVFGNLPEKELCNAL